uniref:CIA30 domain-containing protein n=1 Tax=Macrostomum lignano TaxID=282301 RepID=A0A1I8JPL0_9PLAT
WPSTPSTRPAARSGAASPRPPTAWTRPPGGAEPGPVAPAWRGAAACPPGARTTAPCCSSPADKERRRQSAPWSCWRCRRLRRRRLPRSRAARPPPAIDGDCRRLLADAQQRQGGQAPLTVPEAAAARLSEVTAAAGPGFGGAYLDDELNTDSAWLELRAFCLHDDTGGLWDGVRLKLDSKSRPRWTELSHKSESKFPPGHWRCLEKLIQLRNASAFSKPARRRALSDTQFRALLSRLRHLRWHPPAPGTTALARQLRVRPAGSARAPTGPPWCTRTRRAVVDVVKVHNLALQPARPDKLLVHHPAEGVQLSFRILVLRQHRRHVGQVTLDRLER